MCMILSVLLFPHTTYIRILDPIYDVLNGGLGYVVFDSDFDVDDDNGKEKEGGTDDDDENMEGRKKRKQNKTNNKRCTKKKKREPAYGKFLKDYMETEW